MLRIVCPGRWEGYNSQKTSLGEKLSDQGLPWWLSGKESILIPDLGRSYLLRSNY